MKTIKENSKTSI